MYACCIGCCAKCASYLPCAVIDVACVVLVCCVRQQPETEEEAAAIKEKEKKRVEEKLQTVKDRSKVCYTVPGRQSLLKDPAVRENDTCGTTRLRVIP